MNTATKGRIIKVATERLESLMNEGALARDQGMSAWMHLQWSVRKAKNGVPQAVLELEAGADDGRWRAGHPDVHRFDAAVREWADDLAQSAREADDG